MTEFSTVLLGMKDNDRYYRISEGMTKTYMNLIRLAGTSSIADRANAISPTVD